MRSRTHRRSQGRCEAVEFGRLLGEAVIFPGVSIGGSFVLSKYRSSILNSPLRGTAQTIQRAMEGAGEAMTRDVVWSRRLRPGRGVARSLSCKDSQNAGLPQR